MQRTGLEPAGPVTIEHIAHAAGVHPASVSRALRGVQGKVSAETRERIVQIARELGYQPNAVAASLRTKQTNLVAIVVPDVGNPLFGPIVQGLEAELRRHGYMSLMVQPPEDPNERRAIILALANRNISGLMILAAESDDPMLQAVAERSLAAVLVNRGRGERRFSSVVNDDRESVRLVLEHLASLGHTRIGHISGPLASSTGRARRDAFVELAPGFGIQKPIVVEATAFTLPAGAAAARELWRRSAKPTAIFAANDLIALGALGVLREAGVRVPQEVSLVGHNDMPFLDLIDPPLTTVRVAADQMSRQSAQLLLELMREPQEPPSMRVLTPRLVVRGSTAPPSRA
ncbi:MAG TPA: LacI family DNA-binding transcriptional regulator [Ramlibacter sp.]|nr:LacI family DNA-binding transcriptional regulator [Ramlibacter sp.]